MIWEKLELVVQNKFKISAVDFFSSPENYVGIAVSKAMEIVTKYTEQMRLLKI